MKLEDITDFYTKTIKTDEIKKNILSASKLVKQTAKQYMFNLKNEASFKANTWALIGTAAEALAFNKLLPEMEGSIPCDDFSIRFTVDGIKYDKTNETITGYEHKIVLEDKPADYYIKKSILQSILYHAFLLKINKLESAFFVKENRHKIKYKKIDGYFLVFTSLKNVYTYEIPYDKDIFEKVKKFYIAKAKRVFESTNKDNWDLVKEWDAKYKDKDYNTILTEDYHKKIIGSKEILFANKKRS